MFPLARFRIADDSMEPALRSGDYILVNRWAYRRREPSPGDVVVFRSPEDAGQFLVKRILSGSRAEGYTVLGDNRAVSRDSRHFGAVPRDLIVGRVRYQARA